MKRCGYCRRKIPATEDVCTDCAIRLKTGPYAPADPEHPALTKEKRKMTTEDRRKRRYA